MSVFLDMMTKVLDGAKRLHIVAVLLQQEQKKQQSMKNNNRIYFRISIISIAILTIALAVVGLVDTIGLRFVISAVAVVIVGLLFAFFFVKRKREFSDIVMTQLRKVGLACGKNDDGIVVKQGDFILKARLWNSGTHGLKRVHFILDFAPNIIKDVKPEGWAVLASECNAHFDHTTVKFYGDHFCCMVETSVKSAKDFLDEYRFAFEKINETLQGIKDNVPRVANQFPIKKKQIGFTLMRSTEGESPKETESNV